MRYSAERKEAVLKKMLPPENKIVVAVALTMFFLVELEKAVRRRSGKGMAR